MALITMLSLQEDSSVFPTLCITLHYYITTLLFSHYYGTAGVLILFLPTVFPLITIGQQRDQNLRKNLSITYN